MKYLLLLLTVFLLPAAAKAQTPVSKETANTYFQSCVKQTTANQSFSQQGQQMLCACTAARLTQFFTMEDWQNMMKDDPAVARPAYNKMLIDIYAPCMGEPAREYHYQSCISSPDIVKLGNPTKICQCAAEQIAVYMQGNGSNLFQRLLSRNPNATDPNALLFGDSEFQRIATEKTMKCLK